MSQTVPVAVIGAGPVGLAAVAHLIERGETPLLFEAGERVASNVRDWAHVRMFSPWEFVVDSVSVRLLEADGWQMPPLDELPTGGDLVQRYLEPFTQLAAVRPYLHFNTRVIGVSRRHTDKMKDADRDEAPFIIQVQCPDGSQAIHEVKAVIDASGTWHNPNPLGAHGIPAMGERQYAEHIAYGIPEVLGKDRETYANKRVMVVGSGHSAINALLELGKLQETAQNTRLYWVMRRVQMHYVYGGGDSDQLEARGALGKRIRTLVQAGVVEIVSPFFLERIEKVTDGLRVWGTTDGGQKALEVDQIIGATGARPGLDMLRELRLKLDSSLETTPALAPMIDPNLHHCGSVRPHGAIELAHPETNFYMVGMKSYGRAPSFLLATGYEQVRSVVAMLAGDEEAAREVHLNLPETGVCITDFAYEEAPVSVGLDAIPIKGGQSSCCG